MYDAIKFDSGWLHDNSDFCHEVAADCSSSAAISRLLDLENEAPRLESWDSNGQKKDVV